LRGDEQRRRAGEVLLLALLRRVLRRREAVVVEGEGHGLAEVLDRGDLREDLLQARGLRYVLLAPLDGGRDAVPPGGVAEQPVEALGLQPEEVGRLERLLDLGERDAARCGPCGDVFSGGNRRGARGSQRG